MDRAKQIGELAIRHFIIRKRIEKIRNSLKPCSEYRSYSPSSDYFADEPNYTPECFIQYHTYKNDTKNKEHISFDDMCPNCKERERTRKEVNRISLEGAAIKRRMTGKVKNAIKENNRSNNPIMYNTTEELFEMLTDQ